MSLQKDEFAKFGIMADWSTAYSTMSGSRIACALRPPLSPQYNFSPLVSLERAQVTTTK